MGHLSLLSDTMPLACDNFLTDYEPELTYEWEGFNILPVSSRHLEKNQIICAARKEKACSAFNFLRTRMMQVIKEKNWRRIGITSPTNGCGKTFIATNLSITLARGGLNRVMLLDMNLKNPGIERIFDLNKNRSMTDYLSGALEPQRFFLRVMPNLMVGFNNEPVTEPAEALQEAQTAATLDSMQADLTPGLTIFDMPSLLSCDEAIACFPHLDGVIMVVEGGKTTKAEIRYAEKLMDNQIPLLGVILNHSKGKIDR